MATLAENIDKVVAARDAIAAAVGGKGVEVPAGTGLVGLAELVSKIAVGGDPVCAVAVTGTDGTLAVDTVDESPVAFDRRYYKRTDALSIAAYVADAAQVGGAKSAFYGCKGLTSASLHGAAWASVTNCHGLFCNCTKLESVVLPQRFCSDATMVDAGLMFYNCPELGSLTLPDGFGRGVTLANSMFHGCSSLEEIVLPAGFGADLVDCRSMFAACSALRRVVVPPDFGETVQIGITGLFTDCPELEEIEVAGGEGSPYAAPDSLDLSGSPKLSRDSLVRLISGLATGYAGGTSVLTLGKTLMAKLADADALAAIEAAKSRNWTIE